MKSSLFLILMPGLPILFGFALDALVGDPYRLPHPVRLIGRWIAFLERRLLGAKERDAALGEGHRPDSFGDSSDNLSDDSSGKGKSAAGAYAGGDRKKRARGRLLVLFVLLPSAILPAALLFIAYHIHIVFGLCVETILSCYLLAARCLVNESGKVYSALRQQDLPGARAALSMIVGRDTADLSEEGIVRAAVETVAESASDGVGAPLFYLSLGGVPLGFLYKAANTMDSMLGYRNARYVDFGRAAARLDDLLNFLPSRLTAVLTIGAAAFRKGFSGKGAYRIWRRDRRKHDSPNAGQTESAYAGALGLTLGGDATYGGVLLQKPTLGDGTRPLQAEEIRRANRLMYVTAVLAAVLAAAVRIALCFWVSR